jgi:RNA polymerase sigma factor (sigma-70 family)
MLSEQEFLLEIKANQRIIFKICRLYLDNEADREDLFQEILLQAWRSIDSFRGNSKFSTWLYRVGLNTAISYYRQSKRQPVLSAQDLPLQASQGEDSGEELEILYKAISELSKVDKALVTLYLEDYDYKEIGEMLGMTANNVAVKMNRIKARLQERAKKYA